MGWEQLLPTVNYANHIQILPNQRFGPRINPDYQIICVHRGTGRIMIEGKKYEAKEGDFFCYGPDVIHIIEGDEQDPFFLSGVLFDLDRHTLNTLGARDTFIHQEQPKNETEVCRKEFERGIRLQSFFIPEHMNLPYNHSSFKLFNQIVKEYEDNKEGSTWICRGIMIQLLGSLFRSVPLVSKQSGYYHFYSELVTMIATLEKENQLQYQTVHKLANKLGLSQSYFYTVFKACYGVSPQSYLIQVRVSHAKRLLKQNHQSLEKVAYLSGFGNVHYFSRVFRKIVGEPPALYRRK